MPYTDVLIRPKISDLDGGHERFAHIVRKDGLTDAIIEGKEVEALCGKRWIPSHDPEKYPLCPECAEIYYELRGKSIR